MFPKCLSFADTLEHFFFWPCLRAGEYGFFSVRYKLCIQKACARIQKIQSYLQIFDKWSKISLAIQGTRPGYAIFLTSSNLFPIEKGILGKEVGKKIGGYCF